MLLRCYFAPSVAVAAAGADVLAVAVRGELVPFTGSSSSLFRGTWKVSARSKAASYSGRRWIAAHRSSTFPLTELPDFECGVGELSEPLKANLLYFHAGRIRAPTIKTWWVQTELLVN
jgi:hypothetical protein